MAVRRIKNINEGVKFNKKTFLQNCKDIRMRLSDVIDDDYYNNMDDLNDDDIDIIESEINDIIGMCKSILSEFNLLDESKELNEVVDTSTKDGKKVAGFLQTLYAIGSGLSYLKNHMPSDLNDEAKQTAYINIEEIQKEIDVIDDIKKKYGIKIKEESKKLKESKLREFTKSDWDIFAGADKFDDGSEPLIAEFADGIITLIVSGTGDVDDDNEAIVQLIYNDYEESEDGEGAWYKDFESKKDAIKFALEASAELDYYTSEDTEYDDVENFAYSNKMSSLM